VDSPRHLEFLKLACRELELFSLPGVGTFVRKKIPARLDPEKKVLLPPSESIELVSGRFDSTEAFLQLLCEKQDWEKSKAQDVLEEMATDLVVFFYRKL
jgi:hypothetical protein